MRGFGEEGSRVGVLGCYAVAARERCREQALDVVALYRTGRMALPQTYVLCGTSILFGCYQLKGGSARRRGP